MPVTSTTVLSQPLLAKYEHLVRGDALSQHVGDDAHIRVVYGCGRGTTLELAGDGTALCIPLRGRLDVMASGVMWPLSRGAALVVDHGSSVRATGHADSRWLVVNGGGDAWAALLRPERGAKAQPLPELHDADHELLRLTIALVRNVLPHSAESSLRALGSKFASMQAPLQRLVARCPGRTSAQRHQVFLRLQRVRQLMRARCDGSLDIEGLASMASYSPCHFVRIFHKVYGTTPYAYLVAQRMERARNLLRSSRLAIMEVAMATGFESRMSFSRQFRSHFGMTAREARRHVRTVIAPA